MNLASSSKPSYLHTLTVLLALCVCTCLVTSGALYTQANWRTAHCARLSPTDPIGGNSQSLEHVIRTTAANTLLPPDCAYFWGAAKFNTAFDCNITLALKHSAAAAKAGGCMVFNPAGDCKRPAMLTTHTWLRVLNLDDDTAMRRLVLLVRAWMITQDLRRSKFIIWASDVLPNVAIASIVPWLAQYAPYVTIRRFNYTAQIAKTPLFLSRHFNNWTRFDSRTSKLIALQSDVIRNVLLFNYGGLWLDTDAVPLRDLWDITAGLGLQFIPKFERGIANGHVMYALCPKSPLARRRLESMMLFPIDHPNSWPRRSTAFGNDWVFNDALSEQVRASQAIKYNLPLNAEDIDFERVPADAWLDLEVPFPIAWFDNWWVCHGLMRARNNGTDFLRKTACNGTYIYHRLTKHIKGDPETWGPKSGGDQFWDEIYGGPAHDYKAVQSAWSLEPVVLTGGASCP